MNQLTQNLIVAAIALAAAGYLLRRGWLAISGRKGGSCGGCKSCGPKPEGKSLASLDIAPLQISPPAPNKPLSKIEL